MRHVNFTQGHNEPEGKFGSIDDFGKSPSNASYSVSLSSKPGVRSPTEQRWMFKMKTQAEPLPY
jgi:hypothetical protein